MIRNVVEIEIELGFDIGYIDLDYSFDEHLNYIYSNPLRTNLGS